MANYTALLSLQPASWPAHPFCPTWFNVSTGTYGVSPTYPGIFSTGTLSGSAFRISYFVSSQEVLATTAPTIITDLSSTVSISENTDLHLLVSASGSLPMTFTWYKGSTSYWVDPSPGDGGTSSTLIETNRQTTDTGATYHCVVSNGTSPNATSTTTTLTVLAGSGTGAPTILTNLPTSFRTIAGTKNFVVSASGSPTLVFTWYKDSTLVWTDPSPATISGGKSSTYSESLTTANIGSRWYCHVDNGISPAANSNTSTLSGINVPPVITTQPGDQTVYETNSAAFFITTTGDLPITYAWYTGPNAGTLTPVSGATAATLYLGTTSISQTGTKYWCIATNASGSVLSSPGTLTVNAQIPTAISLAESPSSTNTDQALVNFSATLTPLPMLDTVGYVAYYRRAHGTSDAWVPAATSNIAPLGISPTNPITLQLTVNGSSSTGIPYGNWDIYAKYSSPYSSYAPSPNSNIVNFVGSAPSTQTTPSLFLTSSNLSASVGAAITLTATLPVGATGTVSFLLEATTGAGFTSLGSASTVNSGTGLATFSTVQPTGSTWTFKAVYSGDSAYYSTNALLHSGGTVIKTNTSLVVTSDSFNNIGNASDDFRSTSVNFSAKLTPASILSPSPSGDIIFTATNATTSESITLGSVTLNPANVISDGSNTVVLGPFTLRSSTNLGNSQLSYGAWTITASYATDSYYNASSSSGLGYTARVMTIVRTTSNVAGTWPNNIVSTSTSITFTATMDVYQISTVSRATITGSVNFYAQEINISSGLLVGSPVTLATNVSLSSGVATHIMDFSSLGEAGWEVWASYNSAGIFINDTVVSANVNILNSGLQMFVDAPEADGTTGHLLCHADTANNYAACQQCSAYIVMTPTPLSGTLTVYGILTYEGYTYSTNMFQTPYDINFTGSNTEHVFGIFYSYFAGENQLTSGQNINVGNWEFWAHYSGGTSSSGPIPAMTSAHQYLDVIY